MPRPSRFLALLRSLPLLKFRRPALPKIRLPVLTAVEKTALAGLAALLCAGAGLRAWERSGVRLGPVGDWETLRRFVLQARAEQGDPAYACAEAEILAAGILGSGSGKARGKGAARSGGGSGKTGPARPVDLNTAGEKALLTLPGVGPSTARAILAHRAARGPFAAVEDLLQVKGIGPKKLEALRPFVRPLEPGRASGNNPQRPDSQAAPAQDPPLPR
jgi:competence ComEA-like helix-hairpin-helix protein